MSSGLPYKRSIGIVGAEAVKFTLNGKDAARQIIRGILLANDVREIVSGACHLGGVDIWAAEIGRELGLPVIEYPPKDKHWFSGYKPRNIQIAQRADIVHCIVVSRLPESYTGMRFKSCYHCGGEQPEHVKSGGCWTMWFAMNKLGKAGQLHVIAQ